MAEKTSNPVHEAILKEITEETDKISARLSKKHEKIIGVVLQVRITEPQEIKGKLN